ncbi:MAG: hypothetical protein KL787_03560 [Taibaiella sp.]|nr:hypothetical protein [Taibaiella sp.]
MYRLLIPFLLLFIQCNKPVPVPDYENHRTSFLYNNYPSKPFDSTIKILTLNMHLGFKYTQDPWNKYETGGTDDHLEALAGLLNEFDADVIALQEVPLNRANTINKDYIEKLAKHLRMNVAFGAHGYNDATGIYPVYGEWGNAILSKFQILEINNIEIVRISEWEKRSMLVASIKVNDDLTFALANIHYIPKLLNLSATDR